MSAVIETRSCGDTDQNWWSTGPSCIERLGSVPHRFALVGADELLDVAVERGREQQRLAIGPDLVEDAVDLGKEAHVGHAVGLVHHHDVDLVEADGALVDQVLEAAGRRTAISAPPPDA